LGEKVWILGVASLGLAFLRILPTKFGIVVVFIEESKGLTYLFVNNIMGSLQYHDQRMNRFAEKYFE
jgi:hypothetical protein